ncbi:hypothetical protein [Chengkuizengella axinellae]|uniref:DUF2642 domain-containing protein n=1 Tax=Chengkuizengella axinellae TaxID=3064388 RepID=A0ABT9J299_9BACL|nr:hypothetical protein [Chengkuizengella sp. 2205SS18-9]MDP5275741.1 hypothetical protein [Chengkuizengella sp. 2205SS18-9]
MYQQEQAVLQASRQEVESMQNFRNRAYHIAMQHMNKPVRIQTIHGQIFEGTIVNVDQENLYLRVSNPNQQYYPQHNYRFFFGGGGILVLSLFLLLVIVLLLV